MTVKVVVSSGANWGGGGWGAVAPPPPQDSQKFFFYLFHRFNVQYMYKHVKLYYISVHELLSIGGADTELLARQRKKKFSPTPKKILPPQEICELAPLVVSVSRDETEFVEVKEMYSMGIINVKIIQCIMYIREFLDIIETKGTVSRVISSGPRTELWSTPQERVENALIDVILNVNVRHTY